MIFNILLSIGFVGVFLYIVVKLLKAAQAFGDNAGDESLYEFKTIEELKEAVFKDVNTKTSSNNLALKQRVGVREAETMEQIRRLQAEAVRNCTSGSEGARETTKQLVRNFIAPYLGQGERAKRRLRKLIDFEKPDARTMYETILYVLGPDDYKGFMRAFEMMKPENHKITEKDLRPIYKEHCTYLNEIQKQEVLTQLVYADTFGLGTIDSANYQKGAIDEIQIGVGGLPASSFSRHDLMNVKLKYYSCNDVRFMVHGDVYRVPFLGFGNDMEIERVCSNLIKCTDGGELTDSSPAKQIDAIDGRRLNVYGKPSVSAYAALIRKYDSFDYEELDIGKVYAEHPDGDFIAQLLKATVNTGRNIAISGLMAAGKTWIARFLSAFLPNNSAIRSVEIGARELGLRRFLSSDYSVLDFKICEGFDEDTCFSVLKQSSGDIGIFGEVNSDKGWQLLLRMTMFFPQTLWTTFETSTEGMVEAAKRALLEIGYAGDHYAAERQVANSIQFNIKMEKRYGRRYIKEIVEVLPVVDNTDLNLDESDAGDLEKIHMVLMAILRHMKKRAYKVVPIVKYDEETERYSVLNDISDVAKEGFKYRTGLEWPGINFIRQEGIDNYLLSEAKGEAKGTDSAEEDINTDGGLRLESF